MDEDIIGKKEIRNFVILLLILDTIYLILFAVFINTQIFYLFLNIMGMAMIEGIIVLFYYIRITKKVRKIDVSIYQGKGTKQDPIIINSITSLPIDPILFKMKNLNIVLKDLKLDNLAIYYSKNINIGNCSIKDLHIYSSEEIEINNSSISKSLSVSKGNKISIDSSEIGELYLDRNIFSIYQNNRINNIVHHFKEKPKSNNIYRNNTIVEKN